MPETRIRMRTALLALLCAFPCAGFAQNEQASINVAECKAGNRVTLAEPLGSEISVIKGLKGSDTCILSYTREVEGGYTQYECKLKTSLGIIALSQVFSQQDCTIEKSGNFLLDSQPK